MPQQIFAHDHQRQSRRADVLLRARINHAEARYVVDLGHDVRRHIRHQRHAARFRQSRIARAKDGVVGGDVEIGRVAVEIARVPFGDAHIVFIARGRHAAHVAIFLRLDQRAVGEIAAVDVIRALPRAQQIQRDGRELSGRAALQQQHLVVGRNVHQLAYQRDRFVKYFGIHPGAMAHFHYGHAAFAIAQHFARCGLQRFLRHGGRPGCEIIHAIHINDHSFLVRAARVIQYVTILNYFPAPLKLDLLIFPTRAVGTGR